MIETVSNLPHGANGESAAAAVRALAPKYKAVTAVDSGLVSPLTQQERPSGDEPEALSRSSSTGEEEAHEQLLFGFEVTGLVQVAPALDGYLATVMSVCGVAKGLAAFWHVVRGDWSSRCNS